MADYLVTGIGKTDGATVSNEATTNFTMNIGSSGTASATWQSDAAVVINQRGIRFSVGASSFIFAQIGDNPTNGDMNASYAVGAYIKTPASPPTESKTILSIRTETAAVIASLQLTNGWKIRALNRAGTAVGTAFTNSLAPNSTYWVTFRATKGTVGTAPASDDGDIEIGFFLPDGTTPVESKTITDVDTGQVDAALGRAGLISSTASAYEIDISNIVVRSGGSGLILPPNGNALPSVSIDGPETAVEPWSTVSHTATGNDPDGTVSYAWVVVSTSPANLLTTANLTGAATRTITYGAPATLGGATVTLRCTVTDSDGATASDTVTDTILFATDRWIGHDGQQHPMRRETV